MNWYLTKLVFRIVCGDGRHKAQFDEQIRIIEAPTPEAAHEKAMQLARMESVSGNSTAQVRWEFVNIPELLQLNGFVDGAELYSHVNEEEDGDVYEQIIHRRAAMLQYNLENKMLASF